MRTVQTYLILFLLLILLGGAYIRINFWVSSTYYSMKAKQNMLRESGYGSNNDAPSMRKSEGLSLPRLTIDARHVISTSVRNIDGESPLQMLHVKFELRCLNQIVEQTGNVHVVVYTADSGVQRYVQQENMSLQIVPVPKVNETDFNLFIETTYKLWPHATSYAWVNGDVCPSTDFVREVSSFLTASCNTRDAWRFATATRFDVNLEESDLGEENPHLVLQNKNGDWYTLGGIDYFAWSRDMFISHILPTTPKFSMPLAAADNYLFEDADCNAMILVASAKVYHVNHKHLPPPTSAFGTNESVRYDNWETRAAVDRTTWKRAQGRHRPGPPEAFCMRSKLDFVCPGGITCTAT